MNECKTMSSSGGEGEAGTSVRETQEEGPTGFGDCLETGIKRERGVWTSSLNGPVVKSTERGRRMRCRDEENRS